MKKALLILLVLIIMTSCNNQKEVITLADIIKGFERANLHLKPQVGDGYVILQGIKPNVYELIDDIIYIYIFNSEEDLEIGLMELENEELTIGQNSSFIAKNALVIYIPTPIEGSNDYGEQIHEILSNISN